MEEILEKRKYNYSRAKNILNIVYRYLIDNESILYGGMAIHTGLKAKGDGLYGDYELPDYDFFTTNAVKSGVELVKILIEKGYYNIMMYNGIHDSTTKISCDYVESADITQISKKFYDLQMAVSIRHAGLDYVGYYFQLLYIFKILARPTANESGKLGYDTYNRWLKDYKRLKRIINVHNMTDFKRANRLNYNLKLDQTKLISDVSELSKSELYSGSVAYYYHLREFLKICSDNKLEHDLPEPEFLGRVYQMAYNVKGQQDELGLLEESKLVGEILMLNKKYEIAEYTYDGFRIVDFFTMTMHALYRWLFHHDYSSSIISVNCLKMLLIMDANADKFHRMLIKHCEKDDKLPEPGWYPRIPTFSYQNFEVDDLGRIIPKNDVEYRQKKLEELDEIYFDQITKRDNLHIQGMISTKMMEFDTKFVEIQNELIPNFNKIDEKLCHETLKKYALKNFGESCLVVLDGVLPTKKFDKFVILFEDKILCEGEVHIAPYMNAVFVVCDEIKKINVDVNHSAINYYKAMVFGTDPIDHEHELCNCYDCTFSKILQN